MHKARKFSIFIPLALLALLAAGCGPAKPAALSNEEVLTLTAEVLTTLDTGDYAAFTSDFSAEMLAAFTEVQFMELGDLLHSTSGNFVSTVDLNLSNNKGYAVYHIICVYELEDVAVTIVFKVAGEQVEGLFFDSPNLRSTND